MKLYLLLIASAFLAGCAQTPTQPVAKLKDGELAVPAGYKSWPVFLAGVQRPEVKQIRDLYINPTGAAATVGSAFANGTISLMEIYSAKLDAKGDPTKGSDGRMVKDQLLKVFVMGKGAGWGESAPVGLANGDWIYSAFMADGITVAPDPIASCRACHLPLGAAKDFVHRYDEYFQLRKTGGAPAVKGY